MPGERSIKKAILSSDKIMFAEFGTDPSSSLIRQ